MDRLLRFGERFFKKIISTSATKTKRFGGVMESWSPAQIRAEMRKNKIQQVKTVCLCPGHLQAHVVVIPSGYSQHFERFCELNRAPCSVLYESKVGEVSAGNLARLSDIRTDLSSYVVLKDGEEAARASDLTAFPWDDMVTFYIGSSYPIDEQLLAAGIPIIQHAEGNRNAPVFKTNIPCVPCGPFAGHVLVSMRPVPKELVEKAVVVSVAYDAVHGVPIHIGDPSVIGVKDINKTHFGQASDIGDLVPVFWASGVTAHSAVRAAGLPLAFIDDMDSLFVCDALVKDQSKEHQRAHKDAKPRVVPLRENVNPSVASLLSENALKRIRCLEILIQDDIGKRGIQHLHIPDELAKAALVLSHANSVAVHFGFPCNASLNQDFPDETDGPPGAFSLARALVALGKEVTLIASYYQVSLVEKMARKLLPPEVTVLEFTPEKTQEAGGAQQAARDLLFTAKGPAFDALVAIEAVGRTTQGRYMTMMARDLSEFCEVSPVDELFFQAYASGKISTIGIGDGGNEIGMGKVHERVVEHITNGAKIATTAPADHIITAGVSNWGGSALAAALFILNQCPVHSQYVRRGIGKYSFVPIEQVLSSVIEEEEMLSFIVQLGVFDGVSRKNEMSVDGQPFNPVHADKLRRLLSVASSPSIPDELGQKL